MNRGKVKWYNESKGYGFIEMENGEDIFVHRTGLKDPDSSLEPEQWVVFEIEEGRKGPKAINVEEE